MLGYLDRLSHPERGEDPAVYAPWLYGIVRDSLGTLTMEDLRPYDGILRETFQKITYQRGAGRCFSSRYDRAAVEANIRKAFCDGRIFETRKELVLQSARLLKTEHLSPVIMTDRPHDYYPEQEQAEKIIQADRGKLKMKEKIENIIQTLAADDNPANRTIADKLLRENSAHPQKDRSFHYLPYRLDSTLERAFLEDVFSFPELERLDLEIYYNGDRALTEFRIKCYRNREGRWEYVGLYTPDFLILQRKDGRIYKVLIIETKGGLYAIEPRFQERRAFMETEFLRLNNEAFGYERFGYLYLEDSLPQEERRAVTRKAICTFFEEK